ncbi:MAG TPA: YafY family protein [Thermomicrobiales bacterium]
MRADRLLSILLLLQTHRRMTAGELARRLEVSERTIYRDMDSLSAAGVPVSMARGIGGGCVLPEGYRTNLTGLNEGEIQSLFLATPARLLADLGLRQAAEGALIKLLAALPSVSRRDAEYARQRIHVDAAGWHRASEVVASLPALQEAIWRERTVRFTYQRSDGASAERHADPLGLVAKGNVWYLVAVTDGGIRTYRVSRVRDACVTDEPCTRPDGFDLAAYWEQSSADFVAALPRYPVTVRAPMGLLSHIRSTLSPGRIEHTGEPDAEGRITLRVRFDILEEAAGYAFRFGTQLEVLEPTELRDWLARTAASVAAFYAR